MPKKKFFFALRARLMGHDVFAACKTKPQAYKALNKLK